MDAPHPTDPHPPASDSVSVPVSVPKTPCNEKRVKGQGSCDKRAVVAGRPTTSRYKGVHFNTRTRRWWAQILVRGRGIDLGRFEDEAAAAQAYDDAAREHFGAEARLNFPRPGEQAVTLNLHAALPPGQSVGPSRAERLAAKRAEDQARQAAGWVKQKDAAKLFEVSIGVWNRWKREGGIAQGHQPRVPGTVWYHQSDLDRWLAERGPIGEPYPDPERPGCWRVPLTTWACRRAQARREAVIDAESLPIVRGRRWGWCEDHVGDGGRVVWSRVGTSLTLRRLVMDATDKNRYVIHLNRDPLDCRRANLRVCEKALMRQRSKNMGSLSGKKYTSPYRGVCLHKATGRWIAQIKKNKKGHYLGYFNSEIDAAIAYDRAAWELYGSEAYFNFPEQLGLRQAA